MTAEVDRVPQLENDGVYLKYGITIRRQATERIYTEFSGEKTPTEFGFPPAAM